MVAKTHILHLSDIHLNPTTSGQARPLFESLCQTIKDFRRNEGGVFGLLILSGDLVDKGVDGYELVRNNLQDVLEACDLSDDHVFVVPGNHDVMWEKRSNKVTKELATYLAADPTRATEMRGNDWAPLRSGFESFTRFAESFPLMQGVQPDLPPLFHVAETELAYGPVRICGLNTALVAGPDDYGVPDDQLRNRLAIPLAFESMIKGPAQPTFVVSHYPVSWIHKDEREDVELRLRHAHAILFTGHTHDPKVDLIGSYSSAQFLQLGVGALAGLKLAGRYHCQVLTLSSEPHTVLVHDWYWFAEVGWRRFNPVPVHWQAWIPQTGKIPASLSQSEDKKEPAYVNGFFRQRSILNQDWWDAFFHHSKRPSEVIMVGQSMYRAFDKRYADTFVRWCNEGTRMCVLFLSPEIATGSQLLYVSQDIHYSTKDPLRLRAKILDSFQNLNVNIIARIPKIPKRPLVRFARRDLPFSLMAIDDIMVVTLYGLDPEGDNCPTFLVQGRETAAYRAFKDEFGRIWKTDTTVYPATDPLFKYFRSNWHHALSLKDLSRKIPPPMQAIIYPTYRCSMNCEYCMYRDMRRDERNLNSEISPVVFERILCELAELGVVHIEISGGGEPLEHSHTAELLDCIDRVKSDWPSLKFGLLTNGMKINEHNPEHLVISFDEYIRVSRPELEDKQEEHWRHNVRSLLEAKRARSNCKVSLKYLLDQSNQERFLDIIAHDFMDRDFVQADYVRVTKTQRLKDEDVDIANFEQQVWYHLGDEFDHEKLSIALASTIYPRNFRCWLSPIGVVIDPRLKVFICCNYVHDENAKAIGDLTTSRFADVWNGPTHSRIRYALNRLSCSRPDYCNCRFANLQGFLDRVDFLLGHSEEYNRL